jgi:hypothetical protein
MEVAQESTNTSRKRREAPTRGSLHLAEINTIYDTGDYQMIMENGHFYKQSWEDDLTLCWEE